MVAAQGKAERDNSTCLWNALHRGLGPFARTRLHFLPVTTMVRGEVLTALHWLCEAK